MSGLLRAINLNLCGVNNHTCVGIQVLEYSWHVFLIRNHVRPKGKLVDTGFQDFCPATKILWTQCFGLHKITSQGRLVESCASACTESTEVHLQASVSSSFPWSHARQTQMSPACCADMTLVQHHQQCAIKTPWPLCLSLCKIYQVWTRLHSSAGKRLTIQLVLQRAYLGINSAQGIFQHGHKVPLIQKLLTHVQIACLQLFHSIFKGLDIHSHVGAFPRGRTFLFVSAILI